MLTHRRRAYVDRKPPPPFIVLLITWIDCGHTRNVSATTIPECGPQVELVGPCPECGETSRVTVGLP